MALILVSTADPDSVTQGPAGQLNALVVKAMVVVYSVTLTTGPMVGIVAVRAPVSVHVVPTCCMGGIVGVTVVVPEAATELATIGLRSVASFKLGLLQSPFAAFVVNTTLSLQFQA